MEALQAPLPTGSERSPYQPIDSDAGEICLVELLPGGYDDPISLCLHTVKLEQRVTDEEGLDKEPDEESDEEPFEKQYANVYDLEYSDQKKSDNKHWYEPAFYCQFEYEALSYAWGTAISPCKALVDGFELPITESLDQGLRRLRVCDKRRMLWIDALCINQRDIQERSRQVQHMAAIYRSAKRVVIWLGEWPNNAACSHVSECQAQWLNTVHNREWLIPPQLLRHVLQHFVDIIELPWFRRLWVIQELALARRNPIMLIGSLSTRWSNFSKSVLYIYNDASRFLRPDDVQLYRGWAEGSVRVWALADIRLRSGSHRGLYWCLIASQNGMCANLLDKVYGLLGLCDFQMVDAIAVDYSISLPRVLAEATVVCVLEESAFPYLVESRKPTGMFDRTHLTNSSWILDFTSIPKFGHFHSVSNSKLDMEERKERRGSIRLSMDYQTLYAHGRYVGTVCDTQNSSWRGEYQYQDIGFRDQTTNTEIYDFYHNTLSPRDISPRTLLQVLRRRSIRDEELEQFASLLLGSRDGFRQNFTLNVYRYRDDGVFNYENLGHFGSRDIFVTEEGHLGISWHHDCKSVPKGAILVCLFGTEVPFILAPIPGTQSHEIINVAYAPGYGPRILEIHLELSTSKPGTWINFAAEGGREYAIV